MFGVECLQGVEILFEYGNVWLKEGVSEALRKDGGKRRYPSHVFGNACSYRCTHSTS